MGDFVTQGRPLPRNAEQTRQRILDAATVEFTDHGFAGARIGAIAARSRANQRMIYAYFDSKAGLFEAVLDQHVARAQEVVHLDVHDIPGYAIALFDFYRACPALVRLALWQELELGQNVRTLRRAAVAVETKVAAVEQAQRAGVITDRIPAQILFDQVQALAVGNIIGRGIDWDASWREYIRQAVIRLISVETAG